MKISINAPSETNQSKFFEFIVARVSRRLAQFSNRISRVDVALTDENGPRGGVDKRCRVSLVMPDFGEVVTSAKHENPWAAVAKASSRARRIVLTKLKRHKSLRTRKPVYTPNSIKYGVSRSSE